ncbi:YggS family pyridoxal phosphate-dependent enzyme [Candidatus Methylocalor cossyra]|uniref:Pyridoxal phosphate homeostasis protein n=1 Tax=Candidatus Methylocalor cossyra TaxID=3108543 RepID=A0ABP1C4S1_9GAMM
MTTSIAARLSAVRQRLAAAERAAGRPEGSVQLLAVSKTQPATAILAAYRHGQRDFGESYLQEALAKQDRLGHCDIGWHFIGPLQSNKTRAVAARFAWVHSLDRLKIAERLNDQRPPGLPPLNVCIQVNVSGEPTKSGVAPEQTASLAARVAELPRLRLRGLMAIPAPAADPETRRTPFRVLKQLFHELAGYGLDTLSMGMSEDWEEAVLEGATWVRLGTAIFGARPPRPPSTPQGHGAGSDALE